MLRPPTPAPFDDPVSAVLTNRDLVHEIVTRVAGGALSARERAAVRTIGAAFADAADRVPVCLDAGDPTSWALARHSSEPDIATALRGLVSLDGGAGCRHATLAAARLLRAAQAPPSLTSVSVAHLTTPWLARALGGRTSPLETLSATGFWHRPASGSRLPACGAARLTLTQLPGGGVGAGKAALLPHAGVLGRVASVNSLTLVGLAGAVLDAAPPDLTEVSLERVPVLRVDGGRVLPPPLALPPGHGRLARLSLSFEASGVGHKALTRPAVVDLLPLGAVAEAVSLTAPGQRAVRLRIPARFFAAGADAGNPAAIVSALRSVLVASGVGSVVVEAGAGWEVAVVEEGAAVGGGDGVVEEEEVGSAPGSAILAAGLGSATPGGGWAWSAGRR